MTLAFEVTGDCAALIGPDDILLGLSATGSAASGFEDAATDTVRGREWTSLWSARQRAAARQALDLARRDGRAELRTTTGTGKTGRRWWDNTLVRVAGAGSGPDRVLAISREATDRITAERALRRSARLHNALIEATSEIVWHFDAATGLTQRRGYVDFTGEADDAADADGWLAAVHPEDRGPAKRAADGAEITRQTFSVEYRLRHKSGLWRWVEDRAVPLIGADGVPTDWVGIITDIDKRKSAEQAVQKSAEHLRFAIEASGLCTWEHDITTGQREWSPELCRLLGLAADIRPDPPLFYDRIHPDDRARVAADLDAPATRQAVVCRLTPVGGGPLWIEIHARTFQDAGGRPVRRVGTIQDITARKEADLKVWRAAHTDPLTGVGNRALFHLCLDEAVAEAVTSNASVALFLIDVDRFKEVNDTLGHGAGDHLLTIVADRLRQEVGGAATVARLGGDEFGVVVPAAPSLAGLEALAVRLVAALARSTVFEGHEVHCSGSIGWAAYPEHDAVASTLLKNADVALYAAKAAGRGCAMPFAFEMRDEVERRVTVLRRAREALGRDAILPFYQPKVSLLTGEVVGFEALLRWSSPEGIRSPGEILEALDHPELSAKIGARMLDRVVADMQAWTRAGLAFGHVGVNVAAPQLRDAGFAERTLALLRRAKIRPDQFEIEVTERVLLDRGKGIVSDVIGQFHEAGVAIALDDFGTGYASLTHLTRFPVGWLKIDRSFVSKLEEDRSALAIVKGILSLAHGIGIKVIGEGIETRAQMLRLLELGCELGQGYLFAKPMSAERVPAFLSGRNARPSAIGRLADGKAKPALPARRARVVPRAHMPDAIGLTPQR